MGDVADEHADERPGGDPDPGAAVEPSTPSPPVVPPSEEQLREFQQFQQFQDYLKYTEAQRVGGGGLIPDPNRQPLPPPMSPQYSPDGGELVRDGNRQPALRPKMPGWLTWLIRKVVGWVIALLLIGLAGTVAYHHFFPSTTAGTDTKTVTDSGGGTYHTNHVFSTDPYDAVAKVYKFIASPTDSGSPTYPVQACGLFDEPIQAKFARDVGQADGNCLTAVLGLHPQVTDPNAYFESISNVSGAPQGATMTINSCDFDIQGGPALGTFTVTRVELGQWLITNHTPGPAKCTAPTPTTPTTP
jgi:hypothetical protein